MNHYFQFNQITYLLFCIFDFLSGSKIKFFDNSISTFISLLNDLELVKLSNNIVAKSFNNNSIKYIVDSAMLLCSYSYNSLAF